MGRASPGNPALHRQAERLPNRSRWMVEPRGIDGSVRLTEEAMGALTCEPGKGDRLVFDDTLPGLALRITAGGG